MGWDQLEWESPKRLLAGLTPGSHFYFANSYYCPVVPETTAVCRYGVPFTAVLEHDNLFGVQFHPEKSGPLGLRVVANFVRL
jgi:imidazoleglycerol phosphate synthase glutamine amidotransferase subunit HisH